MRLQREASDEQASVNLPSRLQMLHAAVMAFMELLSVYPCVLIQGMLPDNDRWQPSLAVAKGSQGHMVCSDRGCAADNRAMRALQSLNH